MYWECYLNPFNSHCSDKLLPTVFLMDYSIIKQCTWNSVEDKNFQDYCIKMAILALSLRDNYICPQNPIGSTMLGSSLCQL